MIAVERPYGKKEKLLSFLHFNLAIFLLFSMIRKPATNRRLIKSSFVKTKKHKTEPNSALAGLIALGSDAVFLEQVKIRHALISVL